MGEIKDKRLELLIEEVNIFLNNDQLMDINLIYALISFMAVVILAKIYAGS